MTPGRWAAAAIFGALGFAIVLALAGCDIPTRIDVATCVDVDSIVPDTLGVVRVYKSPCP